MKPLLCAILLSASAAFGATRPVVDLIESDPVPVEIPLLPMVISAEVKLPIRDAQFQLSQIDIQGLLLRQKAQQAQQNLQLAIDAAYKQAGVSKDDYDLDVATWTFVARHKL